MKTQYNAKSTPPSFWEFWIGIAIFAVTAITAYFPLFSEMSTSQLDPRGTRFDFLIGHSQELFTWSLAWAYMALLTSASMLDPGAQFPNTDVIAATHHHWGHLPIFAPAMALTQNPLQATQITLLLNLTLTGAAMFYCARQSGLTPIPSLMAGFIYTFCTIRSAQLFFPELVAGQYFPLAIICMVKIIQDPRSVLATLLLIVFLSLQMLCAGPYAVTTLPMASVFILGYLMPIRSRAALARTGVVALTFAAAWSIVAIMQRATVTAIASGDRFDRGAEAMRSHSTGWFNLLSLPPIVEPWVSGSGSHLGWVAVVLAIIAIFGAKHLSQRSRASRNGAIAICLAGWVFGRGNQLGIDGFGSPFTVTLDLAPPYSTGVAAPHFNLLLISGLALASANGLSVLIRLAGSRRGLASVISLLIATAAAWEYGLFHNEPKIRYRRVGPAIEQPYRELQSNSGTLLELPIDHCSPYLLQTEANYLYKSTYHWNPLINGRFALGAKTQPLIDSLTAALPDRRATELLQRIANLGVVHVHLDQLNERERVQWRNPVGLTKTNLSDQILVFEPTKKRSADLIENLRNNTDRRVSLLQTPTRQFGDNEIRADVSMEVPATAAGGFLVKAEVEITNRSKIRWPSIAVRERGMITIGYRWVDKSGKILIETPGASRIPGDLKPGETTATSICVHPPRQAGTFQLQIALTQDGRWFNARSAPATVQVNYF